MESNSVSAYADYVRSVLGVTTVLCSVRAPSERSDLRTDLRAELRSDPGAVWAFISVHDQWPVPTEVRAVLMRLMAALKLTDQPVFEAIAAKPRNGEEARCLAQDLEAGLKASGATRGICFGSWALACVQNDPGVVARSSGQGLGSFVAWAGDEEGRSVRLVLTHSLEELEAEPSLRKETWRHLQSFELTAAVSSS